jgi:hypothetical protein
MTSLSTQLLGPVQPATKVALLHAFWGASCRTIADAYWRFYLEECRRALHDSGQHILARTHNDISDTVHAFQSDTSRKATREVLRPRFSRPHVNELELIDRSIDLAARLLLMMDFGEIQHGFSGRARLHWVDGTLRQCLSSHFALGPSLGHEGIRLQRTFNAHSLIRIAGLELIPTTNLLDHLRLIHDDRKLYIFHHASFLKVQPPEYVYMKLQPTVLQADD